MDFEKFDKNLSALLYFKRVKSNEIATKYLFNLMTNDFTDEEFEKMCLDICKTEDLYGRYPDPKLFYSRKIESEKTILIEEGLFFLDDTMPEYKEYLQGFSDDEMLKVWKWIYDKKKGQMVSQNWIIERIKQFSNHKPAVRAIPTLSEIKGLLEERKNND